MKINNKKKAISPLIAGVLLIAFTIALGAILMSWAREFFVTQTENVGSESADQLACSSKVNLAFVELVNGYSVCNESGDNLRVLITNKGTVDVTGIKVQVISADGSVSNFENKTVLATGEAMKYLFVNAGSDMQQVSILPYIDVEGSPEDRLCSDPQITSNEIVSCP
ncbi:MAG: hypothetical protein KKF44_06730 [Nanoarchaeota archaeon]|nr:hypothetical protein [Nanoarchaeota archaeon]